MENPTTWFHNQLTTSADAFAWAIEQVPAVYRDQHLPSHPDNWTSARHVFHLAFYENKLALPAMHIWLGQASSKIDTDFDEENTWQESQNLQANLQTFRLVRAEEIKLLYRFSETDWMQVYETPFWGSVTLHWIVTKTLQHTFEHTHDILRIALFGDFSTLEPEKNR